MKDGENRMKCGDCIKYDICKHILSGGLFKSEEACEAFYDKKKCNMKDCITVIRCKDCKYYNKGFCENINGILAEVATNEYCSRAERKDGKTGNES